MLTAFTSTHEARTAGQPGRSRQDISSLRRQAPLRIRSRKVSPRFRRSGPTVACPAGHRQIPDFTGLAGTQSTGRRLTVAGDPGFHSPSAPYPVQLRQRVPIYLSLHFPSWRTANHLHWRILAPPAIPLDTVLAPPCDNTITGTRAVFFPYIQQRLAHLPQGCCTITGAPRQLNGGSQRQHRRISQGATSRQISTANRRNRCRPGKFFFLPLPPDGRLPAMTAPLLQYRFHACVTSAPFSEATVVIR